MDIETLEKAVLAMNELLKTQKAINESNEKRISQLEQDVELLCKSVQPMFKPIK